MKSPLQPFAFAAAILFALSPAEAQTAVWTGAAGDGNWATGGNWSTGTEPTGYTEVGSTATITLPSVSTTIDGALTISNSPVTINGTTSPFTASYLLVNSSGTLTLNTPSGGVFTASGDFTNFVGDHTGSGVLNLTGAGTFFVPSSGIGLAVALGGVGTVNQTNGTLTDQSGLWIGGDGNTTAPAEDSLGGTGVFNLSGTSTLTASFIAIGLGSTTGGSTPSSGALNINGGSVSTGSLIMGEDDTNAVVGTGTISDTTGAVNQTAGSFTASVAIIGDNPGAVDTYSLTGGTYTGTITVIGNLAGSKGTFTQSGGTASTTNLYVGGFGTGNLVLDNGSLSVSTGGAITLGDLDGSIGTVTQSGGTLTLVGTAALIVGNDGTGVYNQQGGVVTANGALVVGAGSGTGTYTLSGGTLNANSTFTLGGGGSTGVFNLDGGTLNANDGITVSGGSTFNQDANFTPSSANPVVLNAGAIYNLSGGILSISGDVTGSTGGITGTTGSIFNFRGGTVLLSTGNWNDELGGTVSGNSTFDTNSHIATLTGDLTGSGTLTVTGGGSLSIDTSTGNSSSGSWGVDVVNGTVQALATTFPSSGNITIGSSGIVDLTTSGSSVLTGALSGSGAFDITFGSGTDTLELARAASFSGLTTFGGAAGTLEVLDGSFGGISGDGNLVVGAGSGSGSVNLTGNNTYTGSTTVDSGYTLTASNFTGNVTNHGALGSNATLGITPGVTTLSIDGSLTSTGTILVRLNDGKNADTISANTANVTGSTFELVNPGGSGTFTILKTAGAGDLTATNLNQPDSNRLVQAEVEVSPSAPTQDLILITSNVSISSISGLNLTPNEASVSSTLDNILNNPSGLSAGQLQNFYQLINDIAPGGISNAQLAKNLEELTPESLQYGPFIATEHSTLLVQKLDYIDGLLRQDSSGFNASAINITTPGFDSGLGHMMQSLLAFDAPPPGFHGSAPNGVNYYPGEESTLPASSPATTPPSQVLDSPTISDSPVAPVPLRTSPRAVELRQPYSNFGAFVGGDATLANLNQDQGATYAPSSKASYTAADAIAGISYRMTSNLTAGILMDYSHTDADTDSNGSKTHIDSYSPGLFATYGNKGFYLNGIFAYSRNDYSNDRVIPAVNATADSHPDGNQFTGALDAGYDFHPAQGWTVTPAGGLTYTHVDIDSFTESGGSVANLAVNAQHDDSLRSLLGGSLSYQVHTGPISLLPSFSAMWQHEFLDRNAPITSNFTDFASQSFTIHSVNEGSDTALISVGLNATLDNNMAIFIDCTADLGGGYNAENFVGGFKGTF